MSKTASGNFVRSRGIAQYQITDVSEKKNDSIVANILKLLPCSTTANGKIKLL